MLVFFAVFPPGTAESKKLRLLIDFLNAEFQKTHFKCIKQNAKVSLFVNDNDSSLFDVIFFAQYFALSLIHYDDSAKKVLNAIKAEGYKLALDDFGTGYTAFNQLDYL